MAKRLYVGNLPWSVDEAALGELFSQFGEVTSVTLIQDRMSGRSKGFGFVELEDSAAEEAIKKLDGSELEGRKLVVNEARPMEDRPRRDFGGDRGGRRSFGGDRNRRDRY